MEHPQGPEGQQQEQKLEIERKYILASADDLQRLGERIKIRYPDSKLLGGYSETSYYFPIISKQQAEAILRRAYLHAEDYAELQSQLVNVAQETPVAFRLRRRKSHNDKSFILTFKASANPLHDTERIEIETSDISENFLEGFAAQGVVPESVWQSDRRIYALDDGTRIELQNVSGYGWTVEIESTDVEKIDRLAGEFGLTPVDAKSLDKMYAMYRQNWQRYMAGEGDDSHFSVADWDQIGTEAGKQVIRNVIN